MKTFMIIQRNNFLPTFFDSEEVQARASKNKYSSDTMYLC